MRKRGLFGYFVVGILLLSWLGGQDESKAPKAVQPSQPTHTKPSIPLPETVKRSVPLPIDAQATQQQAYVDASRLNVREGPGTQFKRIWTLKDNEKVFVVGRQGAWAKVKGARYKGWVHGDYLTNRPAPKTLVKLPPKPIEPKINASEVRKILIRRSIALYNGRCPCPYNRMKNGRRCGGNSAHSRPGGASPLCFASDISDGMVRDYLARQ